MNCSLKRFLKSIHYCTHEVNVLTIKLDHARWWCLLYMHKTSSSMIMHNSRPSLFTIYHGAVRSKTELFVIQYKLNLFQYWINLIKMFCNWVLRNNINALLMLPSYIFLKWCQQCDSWKKYCWLDLKHIQSVVWIFSMTH